MVLIRATNSGRCPICSKQIFYNSGYFIKLFKLFEILHKTSTLIILGTSIFTDENVYLFTEICWYLLFFL